MSSVAAGSVSSATPSDVWAALQDGARSLLSSEPRLERALRHYILDAAGFVAAAADLLGTKLADAMLPADWIESATHAALAEPATLAAVARDIHGVHARNVASPSLVAPFLFFKGNAALLAYRVAHYLWLRGERLSATGLAAQACDRLGIDIHPAAVLGSGILLDHGTGIVIGETAVVEDDAALWQGVCLGSTFTEDGDRHPKVRRGAVIGAGAIVLGNIEVGAGAVVAANSVVLQPVAPGTTVAGVPAHVVRLGTGATLVAAGGP